MLLKVAKNQLIRKFMHAAMLLDDSGDNENNKDAVESDDNDVIVRTRYLLRRLQEFDTNSTKIEYPIEVDVLEIGKCVQNVLKLLCSMCLYLIYIATWMNYRVPTGRSGI